MSAASFQVGDRVRTICRTPNVRVGMVGTIRGIAQPTPNLYLVWFDDSPEIELMPAHCLELVESRSPS